MAAQFLAAWPRRRAIGLILDWLLLVNSMIQSWHASSMLRGDKLDKPWARRLASRSIRLLPITPLKSLKLLKSLHQPRQHTTPVGAWIVAVIGLCSAAPVLAWSDALDESPVDQLPMQLAQAPAGGPEVPAAGDRPSPRDPSAPRQLRNWSQDRLPARDNEGEADEDRVRWLLGVAANTSPNFFGGDSQHFKLKPVGALEWGRWRLSAGGGYGLMGQGRRDRGSGAQAMLSATDRFNLSLSLNIDRGRDVAETERLKGVPDVRATLRARLRARYNLTERWTASLAASQDILGRGRGMELDGWLGYRWPISTATRLDVGLGASWGNSQYMRSQFGVPQSAVASSGYRAFKPGGGLYQTELGVDLAHALSRHWVLFGGVRYARLHGDARRSPLTVRDSGVSATIGIAWRN